MPRSLWIVIMTVVGDVKGEEVSGRVWVMVMVCYLVDCVFNTTNEKMKKGRLSFHVYGRGKKRKGKKRGFKACSHWATFLRTSQ